jgi:5-(carboxyamino)imidazole ribonucleotide mutase
MSEDQNVLAPVVGVVMGSQSDWSTMLEACEVLNSLAIPYEKKITSAHRTPDRMTDYAKTARERGIKVIIAGAGGAAHLPGMIASHTTLPVLGVPIQSKALNGMDSLLSIAQMPGGIPVGTLAIGKAGAKNAGLLAASILSTTDSVVEKALNKFRQDQTNAVALIPEDEPT